MKPLFPARPRTAPHEEPDTEGSWAISYGDMITLLLTFFVLFYSTDHQSERLRHMEESLIMAFNKNAQEAPVPAPRSPAAISIPENWPAQIHSVAGHLIVDFPQTSFFKLGAVDLTPEGERELREFVKLYLPYAGNYMLGIRAYTDYTKVKTQSNARYRDNLELSALRAVAAMRRLQALGLPLSRMRLGGYGELKLTAEDLQKALQMQTGPSAQGLPLARKIILQIEPDVKEKL